MKFLLLLILIFVVMLISGLIGALAARHSMKNVVDEV